MCQWVSVVQEHIGSLGVSRVRREGTSLRVWGKVGDVRSSGAATVLNLRSL